MFREILFFFVYSWEDVLDICFFYYIVDDGFLSFGFCFCWGIFVCVDVIVGKVFYVLFVRLLNLMLFLMVFLLEFVLFILVFVVEEDSGCENDNDCEFFWGGFFVFCNKGFKIFIMYC